MTELAPGWSQFLKVVKKSPLQIAWKRERQDSNPTRLFHKYLLGIWTRQQGMESEEIPVPLSGSPFSGEPVHPSRQT